MKRASTPLILVVTIGARPCMSTGMVPSCCSWQLAAATVADSENAAARTDKYPR